MSRKKRYITGAMEMIGIRISKEMREKLEKIASEQHRPLSNLVRLILIQWLEEHEKKSLKKPKK